MNLESPAAKIAGLSVYTKFPPIHMPWNLGQPLDLYPSLYNLISNKYKNKPKMENFMKFQSLIVLVLMGASITPIYGSEAVLRTEEESKKRMALVAACAVSGEAVADQDYQGIVKLKSDKKSEDEQLKDAVAILNELSGKDVDGDGKGLPPELRKIVMGYAQQIVSEDLCENHRYYNTGRVHSAVRTMDSKGNPLTIIGECGVDVLDKNGTPLRDFGMQDNLHSFVVKHDIHNKLILTASFGSSDICQWNVENGELLLELTVNRPCFSLEYNKEGSLLGLSKTSDKKNKNSRLEVLDVHKDTCIKELSLDDCREFILARDHKNKMIVVAGKRDGHIELWDVKTGERISVLRGHTDVGTGCGNIVRLGGDERREIRGLAVCKNKKNGHLLIASSAVNPRTNSQDSLVYVWDVQTGECCVQLRHRHSKDVYGEPHYCDMRVVGMDYNDKGELEVYVHNAYTDGSVKALRCVPGDYEQVDEEIRNSFLLS